MQTMPDVSPTKWHRAHVTWFFEQFVLMPYQPGYRPVDERYLYLWNSYYEGVGPRHPRAERGLLSRPGRRRGDRLPGHHRRGHGGPAGPGAAAGRAGPVELGLHHEQQHQELLLMDIKHVLGTNPLGPAYRLTRPPAGEDPGPTRWVDYEGGLVEIGADGRSRLRFRQRIPPPPAVVAALRAGRSAGDRRRVAGVHGRRWLPAPGAVALRRLGRPAGQRSAGAPVLGARRRRLARSTRSTARPGWIRPCRWSTSATTKPTPTPAGAAPGCRPRPNGSRPPAASRDRPAPAVVLHPEAARPGPGRLRQLYGSAWQWTSSAYLPYPGFSPAPGAVGEYNGKFMVNQQVLRGSAAITPPGHARLTYRNFFPAGARWPMTGIRLARDSSAAVSAQQGRRHLR